jgi:hypothetical protein
MRGSIKKLTGKQRVAIEALLNQPTVAEAARVAGIAEQTLGRWKKDPAFDAEYRAAKRAREPAFGRGRRWR